MAVDRYNNKYTLELFGSTDVEPRLITLDPGDDGFITFNGGNYFSTSFGSDVPGNLFGAIKFDGTAVFEREAGFNSSLVAEGIAKFRGSRVDIGAHSYTSISTITINPEGGTGGDPVDLQGNLDISGDLTVSGTISGAISGSDVTYDGDFDVDVTGSVSISKSDDGGGADQFMAMNDNWAAIGGGAWGNYIYLYDEGSISITAYQSWEDGTTEHEDNENYSPYARLRIKSDDRAAFSFDAEKEGDSGEGPFRYIADIRNGGDGVGNHRCLRLALNGDGTDGDSEATSVNPIYEFPNYDHDEDGAPDHAGPMGDSEHQDYFLVCSDEVTSTTDGGVMRFYIDGRGNLGITFTGQHWVVYEASGNEALSGELCVGMIVYSSGEIFNNPKIDEALPVVKLCSTDMDSRVYGVMTNIPRSSYGIRQFFDFNKPYHESCRGDNKNDRSDYSVDSPYYKARVNSVGEGQVWVTNINGEVSNGDYITSSVVAGYGMRQDDDILHSYTVAKCVEEINWDSIESTISHDGTEYKKYLAGCTYHCG